MASYTVPAVLQARPAAFDPRACDDLDRIYYYRRAEQELAAAQGSRDERVVRCHYHLAGFYLDRVYSGIH